ncbi:PIN domain-containing protein [Sphingobacterium sp. SGG-5]|uniref:PIN domain-containing protein n=1 Tax=Sphingobacterium sp. SGG-5 TaxID=2710881 RepID=UPI0013EBCEBE|nr:PIN domain-containing protein [Sphingobacterium sp. SGG-5]NGM63338.1 PIN domain-containing protein [Sphingobacterium sp. SGG-5]
MRLFIDANVIVAVLNKQYPLFPYAARILSLTESSRFKVYTSPVCLAIAFYFAEKKSGTLQARKKISLLSEKLDITTTDRETVQSTVQNKAVHDFEDGLEYYAAQQSSCDIIISEDLSDFYFSEIPVHNCETFLKQVFST